MATQTLPTVPLKPRPKTFRHNKADDGWQLEKKGPEVTEGDVLQFDEFLKEDEPYILGDVMCQRAEEMGDGVGQLHAERLLEQQAEIPEELRQYVLVFPETVWINGGNRIVSCLIWNGLKSEWVLVFSYLGSRFRGDYRVARLRK